jgi:hypothetical protein
MTYTADATTVVFVGLSVGAGVLIGIFARRALSFVALIFIFPIAIASGFYIAELYQMKRIEHSSGESWAGLVIPLFSAGSLAFVAPTALAVVGLKWVVSRKK